MKHPPLDAALKEVERDLVYLPQHRTLKIQAHKHYHDLLTALGAALAAEFAAGVKAGQAEARKCRS